MNPPTAQPTANPDNAAAEIPPPDVRVQMTETVARAEGTLVVGKTYILGGREAESLIRSRVAMAADGQETPDELRAALGAERKATATLREQLREANRRLDELRRANAGQWADARLDERLGRVERALVAGVAAGVPGLPPGLAAPLAADGRNLATAPAPADASTGVGVSTPTTPAELAAANTATGGLPPSDPAAFGLVGGPRPSLAAASPPGSTNPATDASIVGGSPDGSPATNRPGGLMPAELASSSTPPIEGPTGTTAAPPPEQQPGDGPAGGTGQVAAPPSAAGEPPIGPNPPAGSEAQGAATAELTQAKAGQGTGTGGRPSAARKRTRS